LGFQFFKESYTGKIREITLGKGKKAVTVGGETCYPFYQFEGAMPNPPRIAMEVWDMPRRSGPPQPSHRSRTSRPTPRRGPRNASRSTGPKSSSCS